MLEGSWRPDDWSEIRKELRKRLGDIMFEAALMPLIEDAITQVLSAYLGSEQFAEDMKAMGWI